MMDLGEMFFMPRLVEACAQVAARVEIASIWAGHVDLAIGIFGDAPAVLYSAACSARTTCACSTAAIRWRRER